MDNGIYIALSRQLALFRDMSVTANNLANANTTGYGSEHVLFNSYLTKDVNQRQVNPMSFANDISTYRNLSVGPIQETGNPMDIAINGNGYLMVETPAGTRYTRAGHLQIDNTGNLVTANGHYVLDASGQHIVFPDNVKQVDIGSAGNVKINGDDFTSIGVFQFDNEHLLERQGNGLYKTDVTAQAAENFKIIQGALENSNVQPVLELTHMLSVSRAVSDTSKYISSIYDLERKASNAWAQQ